MYTDYGFFPVINGMCLVRQILGHTTTLPYHVYKISEPCPLVPDLMTQEIWLDEATMSDTDSFHLPSPHH